MVVLKIDPHEWWHNEEEVHLHMGQELGWRLILTDSDVNAVYDKLPESSLFSSLSLLSEGKKREERRRYRHD